MSDFAKEKDLAQRIDKSEDIVTRQQETIDVEIEEAKQEILEKIGELNTSFNNLDVNVGETFTTNVACGALPAGSTVKGEWGLRDVIMNLTTKTLLATTGKAPNGSLSSSLSTSTKSPVEVGSTITPTLTASFTDGTFNSYETIGGSQSTEINAGCTPTNYKIYRGQTLLNVITEENPDSQKPNTNGKCVVKDSTEIGKDGIVYKAEISYSDSTAKAKNSDGNVNTSVKYTNSKLTKTLTVYSNYKYYYVWGVTSLPTIPSNFSGDISKWTSSWGSSSIVGNTAKSLSGYIYVLKPVDSKFTLQNGQGIDVSGSIVKENTTYTNKYGTTYYLFRYYDAGPSDYKNFTL